MLEHVNNLNVTL